QKPGFVEFKILNNLPQLDDLWFMLGSRCNLSCKHCYVASSPTNDNLEQMSLEDVMPFLEEAKSFGLKNIYFTGGEPFINKDIIEILQKSLEYGNVTVLTNATFPLTRFIPSLKELNDKSSNELRFRVSLDYFSKEKHEAIRGKGNFDLTLKNVISLKKSGFKVIITATPLVYEDGNTSESALLGFKELFKKNNIDVEVKMLPELEMGSNLSRKKPSKKVFISENCMKSVNEDMFQCHNGRTLEKIDGKMVVYPCPIIYSDKNFELANNLKDSFDKVFLTHKACYDFCYKNGGKCTN
ncbi:radical SAM protein, partial [Candidatus Woesearchaeota archaeon]|nr:radical SAM protein [Candidatus Woesearchaeota archaeon]